MKKVKHRQNYLTLILFAIFRFDTQNAAILCETPKQQQQQQAPTTTIPSGGNDSTRKKRTNILSRVANAHTTHSNILIVLRSPHLNHSRDRETRARYKHERYVCARVSECVRSQIPNQVILTIGIYDLSWFGLVRLWFWLFSFTYNTTRISFSRLNSRFHSPQPLSLPSALLSFCTIFSSLVLHRVVIFSCFIHIQCYCHQKLWSLFVC